MVHHITTKISKDMSVIRMIKHLNEYNHDGLIAIEQGDYNWMQSHKFYMNARYIFKRLKENCIGKIDPHNNRRGRSIYIGPYEFCCEIFYNLGDFRQNAGRRWDDSPMTEQEWKTLTREGVNTKMYLSVLYRGNVIISDMKMSIKDAVNYLVEM